MPQKRKAEANSQQLREDIDAGRTRDKVDHPDPATAPLGTDAEAGGAPGSAQAAEADRERPAPEPAARKRPWYGAPPPDAARPWLIALLVVIVVIGGIAWYFAAL